MKSLSRIIRFDDPLSSKEKIRTIEIREFRLPNNNEEIIEDFSLEEVLAERDRIITEAHAEIAVQQQQFAAHCEEQQEKLNVAKEQWEQDKLTLQQQAYDEAFQQGLEEGRLKAEDNMSEAIQSANETIVSSKETVRQYLESQERVILELAMNAATRILGTALEENEELYLSVIRRGLKEAREMKEIKLYVSLGFHKLVSDHREELASIFPVDVPFMIFVNEELNDTDGYIETNHGRIVVSIDEQLNELRLKLIEILESVDQK
ncbi:flagellar assembly protein FliH [Viridibacillus sp. YIM B01967]|uniref:Flagellar assembly protein FliH n=1 Tax=Viridibacillus soli TaxID=2798301 RepID=A0ABS1H523_9BACL|nr:FliH/SctL family protein [Viridibacillus soli]MBK3494391.1 flagellar assembly protein FliH [Viridibacillus soli]